jgi:hypothetical protein
MPGLFDFLMQNGQGGGLLGSFGQQGGVQMGPDGMPMQMPMGASQQPMQISPPQQQAMMPPMPQGMPPQNPGMAGSLDPSFFANQVRQSQQPPGLMFNADTGVLGGLRGALNQIGDPQGQRQQQAIQNYLAVKSAEEKPQYMQVDDPVTGAKRIVQIQPFGRGASYVNPSEPGGGGAPVRDPTIPVGADIKTVREARAKAAVANEEDSVKSAKAAADLAPHINEMHDAYDAAIKAGAIGPVMGSSFERANEKYNPLFRTGMIGNPQAEAARQRYEIAKAAVQARITAAQNKGEGAVSNYERSMYGAQFPELTAMDPETQIKTLRQIRDQNRQTIEAGKIPSIGQAPQVGAVLDRPAVGAPPAMPPQGQLAPQTQPASPAGPAIAPPSAPIKISSQADYARLPSGSSYVAPDGSMRTKR